MLVRLDAEIHEGAADRTFRALREGKVDALELREVRIAAELGKLFVSVVVSGKTALKLLPASVTAGSSACPNVGNDGRSRSRTAWLRAPAGVPNSEMETVPVAT